MIMTPVRVVNLDEEPEFSAIWHVERINIGIVKAVGSIRIPTIVLVHSVVGEVAVRIKVEVVVIAPSSIVRV